MTPGFWRGRRVLVTGHTGFKGAWLSLWLESLGARVTGLALRPDTQPSLYEILCPWAELESVIADMRDGDAVRGVVQAAAPELVFHLAAQALVRPSYGDPVGTFGSNVMGTVHLLEALRDVPSVKTVVVVTSDKVYENREQGRPFREDDRLGGRDPYSASKACQELVTASYKESFLSESGVGLATARAGNVVGGGDWGADRLVPDFVRATSQARSVGVRNPDAVRPWQHVLDPLAGYLSLAEALHSGGALPPALNFGPSSADLRPVREVVDTLVELWGGEAQWNCIEAKPLKEAQLLSLDASLATRVLDWKPRLSFQQGLAWTVAWYRAHGRGGDMRAQSLEDLHRYLEMGE